MPEVTLHQFLSSHFNDKVRWALAYKGIPHDRVDYLPGPHAAAIAKLSGGKTSTPLLQTASGYISGSAEIIDHLEQAYPEQALYPADDRLRAEALALQKRFDAEVGPATRTTVFSIFINEPNYMVETFGWTKPRLKLIGYRAMLPMVKPIIAKANGVDSQESIDRAFEVSRKALDEVASKSAATGYLVGDRFSVADLTAAALLCPLVRVEHPDMARREPIPASFIEYLALWKDHPGAAWVKRQYAENRP